MKKIFTYSSFCLLAVMTILTTSCKREDLADVVTDQDGAKVALSLENKIEIQGGDNYTLDNSEMVIPMTIAFDGASTKAFTVQLAGNVDTVATLVANETLPPNTLPFAPGSFSIPPTLSIAYGVKSISFNLFVSRTFLEKSYGSDLAFVVKMSGAAKGNTVVTGKTTTIVVVKTKAIMTEEDVHYVTFAPSYNVLNLPGPSANNPGFIVGSQDLQVPFDLALSGVAGGLFTVDVSRSTEIVNAAIADGTLTGAVPLRADQYEVAGGKAIFEAGKNSSRITLAIKTNAVIFSPPGTKLAMGLVLSNPTKFQLGKEKTTMIITMDPVYYKRTPFNPTPFLIKGTINEASDFIPASNYDLGGEGIAYHDNGGRDGGQFRRPDQVDVADNNITIGWTATGEWLSYTVNVEAAGEYELSAIIGGQDDGRSYSIFSGVDNISGGTLPVIKTPGGYGDQQPNLSRVQLKQGIQVIKFYMDNANYDYKGLIFTRKK